MPRIAAVLPLNWEEQVDVPVGPDNGLEPGGPDQGQPAHFHPRRNRFVFRVPVPADFGAGEVVWTLRTRGESLTAYGTLRPEYELDDIAIMANFGRAGGTGFHPSVVGNAAGSRESRSASRARTCCGASRTTAGCRRTMTSRSW